MDVVERNGYELIQHPAYSPDLTPSDFFLFSNLKKDIHGLHFRSDEEVVTAVEEWVNGKDPDFFISGLMVLEHRSLSASHWRAITSKKKRWISTGNKLGWLLIDSPSKKNWDLQKYTLFSLLLLKYIDCGYSLEPPGRGGSYEYPQSMFWAEIWKISDFLSENF